MDEQDARQDGMGSEIDEGKMYKRMDQRHEP